MTSKTVLLNDKFSRTVLLVLFLFSRNILLALFAVITSMRPVQFPFKVFLPRDLPRMKFLLAQQPFLPELIDKIILEVHSHWLSDRPVETNLLLEINHIIPVATGGETVEDNLQTLCWKCNRATSDKIIA